MKKFIALMYLLVFSTSGLCVALVYPYVNNWAMSGREADVFCGEDLLWLLPFIAVMVVSNIRLGKQVRK